MKLKNGSVYFLLLLITLLSLCIRMYHLGSLPSNMQEDEVMTGYVGRYIIQNGKDVYGNKWPLLYFNKFGDFYIIGPIYMKGLSTYLFGVNAFAVRFPTALFGGLTTVPIFLLGSLLFQSASVGLFSAFAVAIMPWTIPLGRASSEGILGGFFFLFGLYYLLLGIQKKNVWSSIWGGIYFLFTFWIYHNYRLLSSLFVVGVIGYMMGIGKVHKKVALSLVGLLLLFLSLTLIISKTPWGRGRFEQTGILSPMSGVATRTQELIYGEPNNSVFVARLFHNKILGYGREFIRQYSIYFSGEFLFIKGGKSEAYAVPEQGLLYLSFILPLIAFIHASTQQSWIRKQKKSLLLLLFCILMSPIPSALTIIDAPNIQRSILLGLLLSLPLGVGLQQIWEWRRFGKGVFYCVITIICAESIFFWHNYTVHTDSFTSMYRNDGQKELITYLKRYTKNSVYLPTYGTMSMYQLFYTKDFSPRYAGTFLNDVKVKRVRNIFFIDSECPSQNMLGKMDANDVVVDPISSCDKSPWQKSYSLVETIKGTNKEYGFRILKPLPPAVEEFITE